MSEEYKAKRKADRKRSRRKYRVNHPAHERTAQQKYRERRLAIDPEYRKAEGHRYWHNEPYENKKKRLEQQGYRCANPGCRAIDPGTKGWQTDHDHETGLIRGELCRDCNVALGCVRDNPVRAEGLAQYLRQTRNSNALYSAVEPEGV